MTSELMDVFEKELLETALVDAMHDHGGFSDQCPLGIGVQCRRLQSNREKGESGLQLKTSIAQCVRRWLVAARLLISIHTDGSKDPREGKQSPLPG